MRQMLRPLVSLFVSCFIMMLGNGLINILLPVRMGLDNLNTDTIGMVLSLYFLGMLMGGFYAKNLIRRAGHIRMFAGCLALASVSILICSLYSDPWLWGAMRIVIGFCNACAFTAMESWLSGSTTKKNRGKVLAFYQIVILGAIFCGQFLIIVATPMGTVLFVLSGILLSAAIIPIVLSRNTGPVVNDVEPMSLLLLFKRSPLGVISMFVSGIIYSSSFNLLPLFASGYGIVDFDLSLYMGAAVMGAFVLQYPVGYLSDRFDRRRVQIVVLLVSALSGFSVSLLADQQWFWATCVATALSCGIIACTYSMSVSESFDRLRQSEMVAASGCMILTYALGGILGPYSASVIMGLFGNASLFWFLGVIQLLLSLIVVYRMSVRIALPIEDQEPFVMQGTAFTSGIDMDPRTEYLQPEEAMSVEAMMASEIASSDPATAVNMTRAVALSSTSDVGAEVAAAVAGVDGIDVLKLYIVMLKAVPEQISAITLAMVKAKPEFAYQLVSQLAQSMPETAEDVAAEIALSFPEQRLPMARVAVETDPQRAVEVAGCYARQLAEQHDAVRPADRELDTSEQVAVDLVTQLSELVPGQAANIADIVEEAMPGCISNANDEHRSPEPV